MKCGMGLKSRQEMALQVGPRKVLVSLFRHGADIEFRPCELRSQSATLLAERFLEARLRLLVFFPTLGEFILWKHTPDIKQLDGMVE